MPSDGPPLGVALLGCGVVGGGVARLLLEEAERLADRAGRPIVLRGVAVRDAAKPRPPFIPPSLLAPADKLLADPKVNVVVELIGGYYTKS